MHKGSLYRMEWFIRNYLSPTEKHNIISVLDVGSYDVNGTYRHLFDVNRFKYTGCDISAGPNVDIVISQPYSWDEIPSESFDVVISGQAFEHIEFFWLTMSEISRVLKRGGLVCVIAPRGMWLHRYPIDTYRFDADGMIALARYVNFKPLHASCNLAPRGAPFKWYSFFNSDSMLVAEKPSEWNGVIDYKSYEYLDSDVSSLTTGFVESKLFACIKSFRELLYTIYKKFRTKHVYINHNANKRSGGGAAVTFYSPVPLKVF